MSSAHEIMKKYILILGVYIIRFFSGILNIFPISKKRIMFYSFNGKYYNCNPREIYKFLSEKYGDRYEYIWSFKDPNNYTEQFPKNVRLVKFRSFMHYYYMKTSKIVVYNVHEEGEVARRKNQIYIQTWHASNGYKNLVPIQGKFELFVEHLHHKNYSYVLSGCKSMEERRVRGSMQFHGEVIHGTPRMDLLFTGSHDLIHEEICQQFNIPKNAKILLFAPTWRKDRKDTNYGLDYASLQNCLQKKFGGEWYILVRFHPNVKIGENWNYDKTVINVTKYPEMQKLLCAADAMISDYSSCVWDYSFMYRPCFLFLPNFDDVGGNSAFEIPIEEWGFPLCFSMKELESAVCSFDLDSFKAQMLKHHEMMGSYEDGHSTARICDLIVNKLNY